jgi:hypothetical protein
MTETSNDEVQESEPEPRSEAAGASDRARDLIRQPRVQLTLGAAILLAAGAVIGWAAIVRNADSGAASVNPGAPVGLSASGLRTLAVFVHQPIYWVGPKGKGYLYELTRTKDAKVYIRYLPPDANVGTKKPHLTIATDPNWNAFQDLKKASHGQEQNLPGGGIALVDEKSPTTVHLAYPGVAYEVDVYDPSPTRAQQVADSGQVRPVGR